MSKPVQTTGNIHTAPRCDQCEELTINGTCCHETGCPNSRKTYDHEREQWVAYVKCFNCGCSVEVGTSCDCMAE